MVHAQMLCPCDVALYRAYNMCLFDDHLCCNDYKKLSSSRSALPYSLSSVERVFHTSSFCVLLLFPCCLWCHYGDEGLPQLFPYNGHCHGIMVMCSHHYLSSMISTMSRKHLTPLRIFLWCIPSLQIEVSVQPPMVELSLGF